MQSVIKEDLDEFLFLFGVAILIIWAYNETQGYMQESAVVPQFILYLMAATLLMILVMKFFGDELKDTLGLSDTEAGFDFDQDEGADQLEGLYDINIIGVLKELVWISAYVLSMIYIGFFTATIVFSVVYILVNETSGLVRRVLYAVGWSAAVLGVLYILFLYFLRVSSVWRLGFLP